MKQAKCPTCNEWSQNTEICEHCGSAISREKQELEYREKHNIVSKPDPPGALQRFFEYGQKSNNPFVKLLYYIVLSIWGVYVGIVVIMLYIAAAAAG
jgi:ribosomal protein L32